MYEKISSDSFKEQALRLIDSHWGNGHALHIFMEETDRSAAEPQITPKKALELKRLEKEEADLKAVKSQALMKAIESVFKVAVQSVKERRV